MKKELLYQSLFNYMYENHNLILTLSEMQEIINEVLKIAKSEEFY